MKKVTVVITSYAHEKYIEKCIESVIVQKDIDFNIVIGDDCSPDKTGEIIDRYAKKYPELITVLPRPTNLGMLKNMKDCFEHCEGEYVAICEGDDYWTDEYKLKKMAEVLDERQDVSFCYTDILLLIEKTQEFKFHIPSIKNKLPSVISFGDLVRHGNPTGNFSCCMYRNSCLKKLPLSYYEDKNNADYLLNLYMLDMGKGIFIKETCSVYRILETGQWSQKTSEQQRRGIIAANAKYNDLFDGKYQNFFFPQTYLSREAFRYNCRKWGFNLLTIQRRNKIIKLKLFAFLTLLKINEEDDGMTISIFNLFKFHCR